MGAEHGERKDWNHALVGLSFLGIVSQGETDWAFTVFFSSFRRPYTEEEFDYTLILTLCQPILPFFCKDSFRAKRFRCFRHRGCSPAPRQSKQDGQIHPPHSQRPPGLSAKPGLVLKDKWQ